MRPRPRFSIQSGPVLAHVEATREPLERGLLPLGNALGLALTWRQPRVLRQQWWLESDQGAHAFVRRDGGFASRWWRIETHEAAWRCKREWGGEQTIHDGEDRVVLRASAGRFGRGRLLFPDGTALPLRRGWTGFRLLDTNDLELVEFRNVFRWLRLESRVGLSDAVRRRDDVALLLAAAWLAMLTRPRHHNR